MSVVSVPFADLRDHGMVSRRAALRGALLATGGVATAALVGCRSNPVAGPPNTSVVAPGASRPTGPKLLNQDLIDALVDSKVPYPYVVPEPDTEPKRGGTFKEAWPFDISTFDSTASNSATTIRVPNEVGERLLSFTDGARTNPFQMGVRSGLATTWEVSPDGLTITFNLTDKAKWHNKPPVNGRPFTSEDARLVYERDRAKGVSSGFFDNVASISAPARNTLQIRMKSPQPDFLIYPATRELVMYAMELVDNGALAKSTDAIGTGPWVLKSVIRGEHISYVRNPDYWQPGRPYIDAAEVRMMPDPAARLAVLRSGQVDHAHGAVPLKRDADALKRSNPDFHIVWSVSSGVSGSIIGEVNLTNPKWQDERVRQALMLGNNRERFIQVLYEGNGYPYMRSFPWAYVFDKRPTQAECGPFMRYDPADAKKLLQAAGQENFSFEVLLQATAGQQVTDFQVADFKEIGVTFIPKFIDYAILQSQFQQKSFSDAAGGANPGRYTADSYFRDTLRTNAPVNASRLSDPDIDQWTTQQSTELNPGKRRELLRKIWDRLAVKAYRPLENGSGGTVGGAWPKYLRNFYGAITFNTAIASTLPLAHMTNTWMDKDQ